MTKSRRSLLPFVESVPDITAEQLELASASPRSTLSWPMPSFCSFAIAATTLCDPDDQKHTSNFLSQTFCRIPSLPMILSVCLPERRRFSPTSLGDALLLPNLQGSCSAHSCMPWLGTNPHVPLNHAVFRSNVFFSIHPQIWGLYLEPTTGSLSISTY